MSVHFKRTSRSLARFSQVRGGRGDGIYVSHYCLLEMHKN